MSERLRQLVSDAVIREGISAISVKAGVSENGVRLIAMGKRVPRRKNAYSLAKVCGCSDEEALALARECLPPTERTP